MLYLNVVASIDILSQKTTLMWQGKKESKRAAQRYVCMASLSTKKKNLDDGSSHTFAWYQCGSYSQILSEVRNLYIVNMRAGYWLIILPAKNYR